MPIWLERVFLVAGIAAIAAIIVLSLLPAETISRGEGDGFFKHFVAYCICAALMSLSQYSFPGWLRTIVILVLLASVLEILQATTATRTPRWIDYFGGVLGTGAGVLAGGLTRWALDHLAGLYYRR